MRAVQSNEQKTKHCHKEHYTSKHYTHTHAHTHTHTYTHAHTHTHTHTHTECLMHSYMDDMTPEEQLLCPHTHMLSKEKVSPECVWTAQILFLLSFNFMFGCHQTL